MIAATIVLLAAWLIVPRLGRRSAAERHLLWAVSLSTAAILPVVTMSLSAWRPEWASRIAEAWPVSLEALRPWASPGPDVVVRAMGIEPVAWGLGDWSALAWVLGSGVVLIALAAEVVKLVRLLSSAVRVTDPRCLHTLHGIVRAAGLSRAPVLLQSRRAAMPMTWGVRRPHVVLPDEALEWSEERLRAVFAHELAHIRRGDWLVHVLAQVSCAAYWFHPLFWLTERRLSREGEQAADDEVLTLGLEGSVYAAHLLEIVRGSRGLVSGRAPMMAMARTSHLERRVAALLNGSANRCAVTAATAAVVMAMSVLVTLPLAAMSMQGAMDVDTLDLPTVTSGSGSPSLEPMLPIVRHGPFAGMASVGRGAVVLPAIAEYTTPPLYSEQARRRRVEGVVTLLVRVDDGGRLTHARVLKGLGFGLDQNALVALRHWRFRPGVRDGAPATMEAEIDVEFSLRSEAINELIANDMATLVGPGVTPPKVVRGAGPLAPAMVRGSVVLDVVLLEDGSPKIVRILRSLTPEADEIAVRHFEQWRFSPAMKDSVPVKVRMNAEVRFHG